MAVIEVNGQTPEQNNIPGKKNYIRIREEKDFIQENIIITDIRITQNGKAFEVVCENASAEEVTSGNKFFPEESRAHSPEKYLKAIEIMSNYLKNIGMRYLGDKFKLSIDTDNWPKAIDDLIKQIKPKMLATKLCAKLEIEAGKDGKFYTKLGNYAPFADTVKALFIRDVDREMFAASKKFNNPNVKPDSDTPANPVPQPSSDLPF
jgi:hypothetical protein